LPIHILDAIFYCDTKRASVFEARGFALDVLNNISAKVSEGYGCRALQRLPHITLLNIDWYHGTKKSYYEREYILKHTYVASFAMMRAAVNVSMWVCFAINACFCMLGGGYERERERERERSF
jgi:hypothetical protein